MAPPRPTPTPPPPSSALLRGPSRPKGYQAPARLSLCSPRGLTGAPRTPVPSEGTGRGSSASWPHEAQQPTSPASPVCPRAEHSPSLGPCPWGSGQTLKPWEASTRHCPSGLPQLVPAGRASSLVATLLGRLTCMRLPGGRAGRHRPGHPSQTAQPRNPGGPGPRFFPRLRPLPKPSFPPPALCPPPPLASEPQPRLHATPHPLTQMGFVKGEVP